MNTIQRFALGLFGITAAVAAAYVLTAPRTVAARSGRMAETGGTRAPVVAGAVPASRLAAGPIVAITAHKDGVYLLQNRSWLRVTPDSVAGPFGAGVRGDAGVIAAAAAIAVTDTGVYVLDRLARALLVYAPSGAWQRTIPLSHPLFDAAAPAAFVLDARGRPLVAGYRAAPPPGRWTLVRLDGERVSELYARDGSPFGMALPLVGADGRTHVLATDDYRFETLSVGSATRQFSRADPPRVPFPRSGRAASAGMPLPDFIPAVAHAFARSTGTFLVAVPASLDDVWIEEIDSAGRPLRTLLEDAVALPVGLSDDAVFTLREEAQQTIIERRLLRHLP